jgi:membrane-associated phospholipid phosphatase
VTYVLVPAAPPWYAAREGLVTDIARISTRGWSELHIAIAGQLISLGQGVVNQVAAIPSLHAGTTFTIAMFFWKQARPWLRALLVAYPAFMIFTLVYGGEHYVIDALLGAAYAVAVEAGWRWWERRGAGASGRGAVL